MRARIGLEVHVQLSEAGTKLFCNCDSEYRRYAPNENVCPVCLGLPGALPVPGRRPVILALAASMALGCRIPDAIVFTRKHYFYPDLPKNYQITQYEAVGGAPVCLGGELRYLDPENWGWKRVGIRRINLEEDPGRTVYSEGDIMTSRYALVDYNRSGVPLLEIVTEPEIGSPRDARLAVEYLLLKLEYLGAVNPRLEGVFRVDANISVEGGERVEVKNIGSTLDVERALRYEELRQRRLLEGGVRVERETRHWDADKGVTRPLRHKEAEEEYLYFPDPDLPPLIITSDMLEEAKRLASETPEKYYESLVKMGIKEEVAWSIVQVKPSMEVFTRAVQLGGNPRILARMIGLDYKGELRERRKDPYDPSNWPPPEAMARLSRLVDEGEYIYDSIRGLVLPKLAEDPGRPIEEILPSKVDRIDELVDEVIREESKAVRDYLSGKEKALNYLVGAIVRRARGKAIDPREARKRLLDRLKSLESGGRGS